LDGINELVNKTKGNPAALEEYGDGYDTSIMTRAYFYLKTVSSLVSAGRPI
jgi:hypothetical protein